MLGEGFDSVIVGGLEGVYLGILVGIFGVGGILGWVLLGGFEGEGVR